jgi:hypothetical protein
MINRATLLGAKKLSPRSPRQCIQQLSSQEELDRMQKRIERELDPAASTSTVVVGSGLSPKRLKMALKSIHKRDRWLKQASIDRDYQTCKLIFWFDS